MPAPTILRGATYRGSHAILPVSPVEVGWWTQLLMDDHVVADTWRCRRTVHQPTKHEANPLIRPTRPCQARGPAYPSAFYDEDAQRFRLWGTVSTGGGKATWPGAAVTRSASRRRACRCAWPTPTTGSGGTGT